MPLFYLLGAFHLLTDAPGMHFFFLSIKVEKAVSILVVSNIGSRINQYD